MTRRTPGVVRATMDNWRWRITKSSLSFCEGCMMSIALEAVMPSVLGSRVNMIMLLKRGSVTRTMVTLVCRTCHGRTESRTEMKQNTASWCGTHGVTVWPTTDATQQCRLFVRQIGIFSRNCLFYGYAFE